MLLIAILFALGGAAIANPLIAQSNEQLNSPDSEDVTGKDDEEMTKRWNLPLPTAGGTQLWTDHVVRSGYRIQHNSLSGHWRLLDASDVRQTWGTRAECTQELDRLQPVVIQQSPRPIVVLLHGLMRTRGSMKPLEKELTKQETFDVVRFSYASARGTIADHVSALREVVEELPVNTELNFVGHSMGNIVVRHLIGDLQRDGDPKKVLSRCRSMVMLGPPNQGAAIARRLAPTKIFGLVTGQGGLELGPDWDQLSSRLATPPFPFLIVAGDVSENMIQNPIVDGSSDFVVSIDEAKLEGAEKFETVPVLHSFLMSDPAAMKLTTEFIEAHRQ